MTFWEAEYMGKSLYSLASFLILSGRACFRNAGRSGTSTLTRLRLAAALPRMLLMMRPGAPSLRNPMPMLRPFPVKLLMTWDVDVCLKALTLTAQAWQE